MSTAQVKGKKQPSLFSLSEKTIRLLAGDTSLSAQHIGAFLVIATHTESSGTYSTAGAKAVRRALAIGDAKAQRLLDDLKKWGYLATPNQYSSNTKLRRNMPKHDGRYHVRWIVHPDSSRRVWFSSNLVRGYGKLKQPLRDLNLCGPIAARLLLALYLFEDIPAFGGVDPTQAAWVTYETELQDGIYGGNYLFHAYTGDSVVQGSFYTSVLNIAKDANGKIHPFWKALESLKKKGFIYQTITVFTGADVNDDMCLLYPLHTRNRHGHAPKGEESVAGKINHLAERYGFSVTGKGGQFEGTYPFIADSKEVQVVGIYRLRFRNTSTAFEEQRDGWGHLQYSKEQWLKTVEYELEKAPKLPSK
jgi:hypothetical protein